MAQCSAPPSEPANSAFLRLDRSFDRVVVQFDAAVVDEARQAFPARQGIADGLGELALLTDQGEFCAQP